MAYNNKITFALLISMIAVAFVISTVSAQAPPLDDPSASLSSQACEVDADCESGSWCREGFCGAYVLEDDWCGGFLPPQNQRRCAPGLTCTDFPTDPLLSEDGNGFCRRQCSSKADCSRDDFCAADGVCRNAGTCSEVSDCESLDNNWVRPSCLGTTTCDHEIDVGRCNIQCTFNDILPTGGRLGSQKPLAGSYSKTSSIDVQQLDPKATA